MWTGYLRLPSIGIADVWYLRFFIKMFRWLHTHTHAHAHAHAHAHPHTHTHTHNQSIDYSQCLNYHNN